MPNSHLCLVDNSVHASLEDLHKHLRKFKITQEDYYLEFHKKKDLLTGENIPFKSVDQYLSAYFVNKNNMKAWYKQHPEEARTLSIKMLNERIQKKGLTTLPVEVELISCGLPSSKYYYDGIGIEALKKETGLTSNYVYGLAFLAFGKEKLKIIIDSREQKPLNIKGHNTEVKKLEFGDYAVEGQQNSFVIERKSLADLISSFVTNLDRVTRELQRAKDAGAYMVILCEESLNTALNYNYIPHFKKYTRVRPEVLFYNIRSLIQQFGFQFVFCDGRDYFSAKITFGTLTFNTQSTEQKFYNYVGRSKRREKRISRR
jgi:ERCC4-type nuclease